MSPFARQFLLPMLAIAAGLLAPAARAAGPDIDTLVGRAFTYAFPLHQMGALLAATAPGASPQFMHTRTPAAWSDRSPSTPESEVLASTAWVNLARGPVRLAVPDTRDRYYSVALFDATSTNFATVGRRTTGTGAGEFILVGPDWISPLPERARVIRAPSNDVLLALRLLVDGPAELGAAHRLQDAFTVTPLQATPAVAASAAGAAPTSSAAPPATPQPSAAEDWLTLVNRMLARNPPPPYERMLLEQFAVVGVCGAACTWNALPAPVQARWNALLPQLLARLERRARDAEPRANGWSRPRAATGDFGTDYELRAQSALLHLLAPRPAEAMELVAREDGARRPLQGMHTYRLHLPPGSVPVDAFWSLAIYEQDFQGRLNAVANPIGRHAVGDRTPGLRRNRDGSIDLWIQRAEPGRGKAANWLPAPPGPFVLVLRAWQPRLALREGRFVMPPVEQLE